MISREILVKIDFPDGTPLEAIDEMMKDLADDLGDAAEYNSLDMDDPQNTFITVREVK